MGDLHPHPDPLALLGVHLTPQDLIEELQVGPLLLGRLGQHRGECLTQVSQLEPLQRREDPLLLRVVGSTSMFMGGLLPPPRHRSTAAGDTGLAAGAEGVGA